MGLEEVLIPPLLRAGQMAVAMHFDAGEETRHRRTCVPLSFRQRRRPAAADLSILVLLYVVVRLRCVEKWCVFDLDLDDGGCLVQSRNRFVVKEVRTIYLYIYIKGWRAQLDLVVVSAMSFILFRPKYCQALITLSSSRNPRPILT
jgi:hypothetical protein